LTGQVAGALGPLEVAGRATVIEGHHTGRMAKDIIVIGGPNGAGKTTAASVLLPSHLGVQEFVNADNIALGLSPFNPDGAVVAAGRVMLERMRELVRDGASFAIETTCAGRGHVRYLRSCQEKGWRVTLFFLWLKSPEYAVQRVAQRVAAGGHDIPETVIVRRYWTGLRNMVQLYLPLADRANIYDNTDSPAVLIASKTPDTGIEVHDVEGWTSLREAAHRGHDGS
jgi:predicted ABC-type ATPase